MNKEQLIEITKLIVEFRATYKMNLIQEEQIKRLALLKKGKDVEYIYKIFKDSKDYFQYKSESKEKIINIFDLNEAFYEKKMKSLGDINKIEDDIYDKYIAGLANTERGQSIIMNSNEIKKTYLRNLNDSIAYYASSPILKKIKDEEKLDNQVGAYIPRMMALDKVFDQYYLDDIGLDILIKHNESN